MFPGTAMSYAIQRPEVPASDDEQHSASYQSRTLSFDSDTSGTTASSSSQMNAFSGGEQRTLFANADRGYDNNVGFGNSVNQGLVFESEDDTPKRSRLTSGMGLLNFNV